MSRESEDAVFDRIDCFARLVLLVLLLIALGWSQFKGKPRAEARNALAKSALMKCKDPGAVHRNPSAQVLATGAAGKAMPC